MVINQAPPPQKKILKSCQEWDLQVTTCIHCQMSDAIVIFVPACQRRQASLKSNPGQIVLYVCVRYLARGAVFDLVGFGSCISTSKKLARKRCFPSFEQRVWKSERTLAECCYRNKCEIWWRMRLSGAAVFRLCVSCPPSGPCSRISAALTHRRAVSILY